MRSNAVVLAVGLALAVLSSPAGAQVLAIPAVSPMPTRVDVTPGRVDGVDELRVGAETSAPYVQGSLGTPWTCVSARRSEVSTEFRAGAEVQILRVSTEGGCGESASYQFEAHAWKAAVAGTVPTVVSISTYEGAPGSWRLMETSQHDASARVDVRWNGVGEERLTPWVVPPWICYALPPAGPACWSAGVTVSRDASVAGSVELLGTAVRLPPAQTGTMGWWAGT